MCGIAGFSSRGSTFRVEQAGAILRRMSAQLVQRGPDSEGFWLGDNVALGHRRLSILDLSGGSQPMCDPETGCQIVFNGEIYNYRELNDELSARGAVIRTRSDTETILKAYAVYGEECLPRLLGMFAFVLYDPRRRVLFGARDPLGKKPFYYFHRDALLVFGSEPKALLMHPEVPRQICLEGIARYLLHEYVPAPYTAYAGMRKLPGGYKLSFDLSSHQLRVTRFFECGFECAVPGKDAGRAEYWEERIRHQLKIAVRRRLIADVPLGAFLSGGIDSSAVVTAMAVEQGVGNVKTFTVGFDDPSFDESTHANFVAQRLGTEHRQIALSSDDALQVLPAVEAVLDEPFADASVLPSYLVSRFARQSVTVALGGDGGDELFVGYDTFRALSAAGLYNRAVPRFLDRAVHWCAGRLPVSTSNFAFDFKVKQFLRGVKVPENERLCRWLGAFTPEELHTLFTPEAWRRLVPERLYEEVHQLQADVAQYGAVTRDSYQFMKMYLQDGVLVKVDRASMACSLEARSPFLDVELVQLANSIPPQLKYPGGNRLKYLLKRALREVVPRRILHRPKKGFGVPIAAWLRGPLKDALHDALNQRRLKEDGFFDPDAVQRMLAAHEAGRANLRKPLWTLFMFQRWLERWVKPAPGRVAEASVLKL